MSRSHSPLCHVPCASFSVQWVQITSVMRTQSSPARQTTAVSLSGPAVTAPMTASTTATSKAAVSACVSADVMLCEGRVVIKVQDQIWIYNTVFNSICLPKCLLSFLRMYRDVDFSGNWK